MVRSIVHHDDAWTREQIGQQLKLHPLLKSIGVHVKMIICCRLCHVFAIEMQCSLYPASFPSRMKDPHSFSKSASVSPFMRQSLVESDQPFFRWSWVSNLRKQILFIVEWYSFGKTLEEKDWLVTSRPATWYIRYDIVGSPSSIDSYFKQNSIKYDEDMINMTKYNKEQSKSSNQARV